MRAPRKMINTNQNLLFIATILALCVISFVHVFLFPLYDINAKRSLTKTFLDFEQSLCMANIKNRKVRVKVQARCPRYGIVTIMQGGRLGNQMWEYASVWALARKTGLEPYIPQCIHQKLEQVFEQLSIPTYEEIRHCPVDLTRFVKSMDAWNYTNQSIVMPRYSIQPDFVLTWVQDIIQEFTFKKKLQVRSQQVLSEAGRNRSVEFVGVHVRRTDYIGYLWRKHHAHPARSSFYLNAMRYFEMKFNNALFVVVSDDPTWCQENFATKSNVYVSTRSVPNPPGLDLAILAACNHSIFDYGTFGIWGAILAGGETVYYNLSRHSSVRVGHLLKNWHPLS